MEEGVARGRVKFCRQDVVSRSIMQVILATGSCPEQVLESENQDMLGECAEIFNHTPFVTTPIKFCCN